MAVTNPATLLSVCNELTLSTKSLLSATQVTLKNPDFFSGKNKLHLKDWAGYEDIAPIVDKLKFRFADNSIAMEALRGQIKIYCNSYTLTLFFEIHFHKSGGTSFYCEEPRKDAIHISNTIEYIELKAVEYMIDGARYIVSSARVMVNINSRIFNGTYNNYISDIPPIGLPIGTFGDVDIIMAFIGTSFH